MQILACDGNWTFSGGDYACSGSLLVIDADNIPQGMTIEDAQELTGHALVLFAVVFGVLAIKKALNLR